jgi:hypothetical protein
MEAASSNVTEQAAQVGSIPRQPAVVHTHCRVNSSGADTSPLELRTVSVTVSPWASGRCAPRFLGRNDDTVDQRLRVGEAFALDDQFPRHRRRRVMTGGAGTGILRALPWPRHRPRRRRRRAITTVAGVPPCWCFMGATSDQRNARLELPRRRKGNRPWRPPPRDRSRSATASYSCRTRDGGS